MKLQPHGISALSSLRLPPTALSHPPAGPSSSLSCLFIFLLTGPHTDTATHHMGQQVLAPYVGLAALRAAFPVTLVPSLSEVQTAWKGLHEALLQMPSSQKCS